MMNWWRTEEELMMNWWSQNTTDCNWLIGSTPLNTQTYLRDTIYYIWQLLSIKENICPERPRKSHALQDGKKYFFLYTTRKMRSTAFQPCITLGGLHWDKMGQKHDFLKKNALKTAFLGDTILDRLTSEGVGSPKKIKNATFLMLSFNDGP